MGLEATDTGAQLMSSVRETLERDGKNLHSNPSRKTRAAKGSFSSPAKPRPVRLAKRRSISLENHLSFCPLICREIG
jgi:hypothetical protein